MTFKFCANAIRATLGPVLLCVGVLAAAQAAVTPADVALLALGENKAVLRIAGKRRVLRVGESSPEGVRLVTADTNEAVIDINGVTATLHYGDFVAPIGDDGGVAGGGSDRVTLWVGPGGMFQADGTINGVPVRFLVDTGASTVALSEDTARALGIDLSDGIPGMASTASGTAPMMMIRLKSVSIGQLTVRNVPAGVVLGSYPDVPLLGTSFLNNFDMERRGNQLDLIKRY